MVVLEGRDGEHVTALNPKHRVTAHNRKPTGISTGCAAVVSAVRRGDVDWNWFCGSAQDFNSWVEVKASAGVKPTLEDAAKNVCNFTADGSSSSTPTTVTTEVQRDDAFMCAGLELQTHRTLWRRLHSARCNMKSVNYLRHPVTMFLQIRRS